MPAAALTVQGTLVFEGDKLHFVHGDKTYDLGAAGSIEQMHSVFSKIAVESFGTATGGTFSGATPQSTGEIMGGSFAKAEENFQRANAQAEAAIAKAEELYNSAIAKIGNTQPAAG